MSWFVAPLFFVIALVYSSVGFGGGSLYIAALTFTTLSPESLRIIALLCNALATSSGSINFLRSCRIQANRIFPILLCSIPTCILTSTLKISDRIFFCLLACALITAGSIMIVKVKGNPALEFKNAWHFYVITAFIGALAGLTGIGGGVYLAPFLTYRNWGTAKQISAICALFIFVNSTAGLITRWITMDAPSIQHHGSLFILTILGGIIGSYFSSKKWDDTRIRKVTGWILIIAGCRILIAQF